jgi:hypothetical protein
MESLSQIVSEMQVRYGMEARFDPLRLQWCKWFRCESSFSVLIAPAKPGIFALGEEMVSPADGSKRMLALFQISEADDLGMALGRLFLPGNPLRERLIAGRCFVRYTAIEDAGQRSTAYGIFRRWMQQPAEAASGISSCGADIPVREAVVAETNAGFGAVNTVRESPPSTPFASDMEVQNREVPELRVRPVPLPSGF